MIYGDKDDEIARLMEEINHLHEKLLRLRSSRRVLLHLLSTEDQNRPQSTNLSKKFPLLSATT